MRILLARLRFEVLPCYGACVEARRRPCLEPAERQAQPRQRRREPRGVGAGSSVGAATRRHRQGAIEVDVEEQWEARRTAVRRPLKSVERLTPLRLLMLWLLLALPRCRMITTLYFLVPALSL